MVTATNYPIYLPVTTATATEDAADQASDVAVTLCALRKVEVNKWGMLNLASASGKLLFRQR